MVVVGIVIFLDFLNPLLKNSLKPSTPLLFGRTQIATRVKASNFIFARF